MRAGFDLTSWLAPATLSAQREKRLAPAMWVEDEIGGGHFCSEGFLKMLVMMRTFKSRSNSPVRCCSRQSFASQPAPSPPLLPYWKNGRSGFGAGEEEEKDRPKNQSACTVDRSGTSVVPLCSNLERIFARRLYSRPNHVASSTRFARLQTSTLRLPIFSTPATFVRLYR